MKQDHLGNKLHVRAVDKFNRVSLPADIAEYLHAKEEMILDAGKQSDRDDLCIFFAPHNRGFLINHFSSHVGLARIAEWSTKRNSAIYKNKDNRAMHFVLPRCDDLELNNKSVHLPDVYLKFSGISEYKKGEKREVVVRQFEHGQPAELGFVQIMDKDIWNKRFPDYTV